MSLLSVVQSACKRVGLTAPTVVTSSTDTQIQQLWELLNEEGQDLSERYQWQALRQEATFTTVATEIQASVSAIAPGLKYIVNDTIWDRALRRPVFGPLSAQRWQQLKALQFVGPWYQFRIINNNIVFIPVPAAGDSCFFEYQSRFWVYAHGTGSLASSSYVNDDDVAAYDEDIMIGGLVWRYKAAKGLDYREDFNKYERRINDAMASDGSKDLLNMGDVRYDLFPGVLVPSGNWPV